MVVKPLVWFVKLNRGTSLYRENIPSAISAISTRNGSNVFSSNSPPQPIPSTGDAGLWRVNMPTTIEGVIQSPFGMKLDIPNISITQFVFEKAHAYPHIKAMECSFRKTSYNYGQLYAMVRRFGSFMLKSGYKKDDAIGIVTPNIPEYTVIVLGAVGVGLRVTLINPLYTPDEMAKLVAIVKPKMMVTIPMFAELVQMSIDQSPSVKEMMIIGEPPKGVKCIPFGEAMKDDGSAYDTASPIDPKNDIAFIPFSSGTSGPPKAVMLTHRNLLANAIQLDHPELRVVDIRREDRTLAVLPFFHCYSFMGNMIVGLRACTSIITVPRFDPADFVRCLAQYKPTFLLLVPPLLSFMASAPEVKREHLEHLHTIFVGAAPCGTALIQKFMKKIKGINCSIREGYGLTESSPVTHSEPRNSSCIASIGQLVPGTECKIVDNDSGKILTVGEIGELQIRGPQIMKGYFENDVATAATMTNDGFLMTGDRGYVDKDGMFYIVERNKDMIKVKGIQVAPAELEEVLRNIPAIKEAAVIGIPDLKHGEVPRAYVKLNTGETITKEEIHEYFKVKVAPFKQLLGGIVFVEEIPKNIVGKILRRVLREQYQPDTKA